jgi:rubredoxin/flavin reductase (DIM6/NTAB) family NADH-FMN oxidoreductase RutF
MNIEAFFKVSYGLYILSSTFDGKMNGHINNTCFQVTAEPAKFAVCTHKNNLTTEFIEKSRVFSISVIQQDVDLNYIGHWGFKSGREFNKFDGINYRIGKTGAPIVLDKIISYIDCEVTDRIELDTHILYVGKVIDSDVLDNEKQALTYSYYRDVIKGLSPKNSPTYIDKNKKNAEKEIIVPEIKVVHPEFLCTVCGYVYEPSMGDPACNIKPGTPFEDLPEDWTCPVCGVTKDMFEKV